jgi:NDP-sugar pyrophosphorylase family protein
MNGDILSLVKFDELYKYALGQNSNLTICVKKEVTPFAFGNIFFDGNQVTGIEEKPDLITYILAGIYVMKPEIFNFFPENEYFGMDHLIKKMLAAGEKIVKYDIREYWLDIGRIDDYYKAQEAAKQFSGATE